MALIKISDFSNAANLTNNQVVTVPYDNYIAHFTANSTSSVTLPNLFTGLSKLQSDALVIVILIFLVIVCSAFLKILEKK